jgi:CTP synthase
VLVCRTEHPLTREIREKLSLYCNIPVRACIEAADVESIYELPLALQREHLDDLVIERLGLNAPARPMTEWYDVLRRIKSPLHKVDVGVVGKYIELKDAYKSVYESLLHGGIANDARVNVVQIDAESVDRPGGTEQLRGLDAILVPGGFGDRGTEGKIRAIQFARENGIPFFGLCLGLQMAVVEYARNVVGLAKANSTEFDSKTPFPIVDYMDEQRNLKDKGATMRLGAYICDLLPGTLAAQAYGTPSVSERHRHRFEVNNAFRKQLEDAGLVVSGHNSSRNLVEIVELPTSVHPWFLAVQFHPEFQSKPNRAHPLFAAFIAAGHKRRQSKR